MSAAAPPVGQVRLARQTDRLDACVAFYRDDLGLPELGRFAGHAGYDGVLLGLPGDAAHLELTHHADGSPASAAAPDDLLVLYLPSEPAVARLAAALAAHPEVEPENPYWRAHGARAFADPDGRGVVLVPRPFGEQG